MIFKQNLTLLLAVALQQFADALPLESLEQQRDAARLWRAKVATVLYRTLSRLPCSQLQPSCHRAMCSV